MLVQPASPFRLDLIRALRDSYIAVVSIGESVADALASPLLPGRPDILVANIAAMGALRDWVLLRVCIGPVRVVCTVEDERDRLLEWAIAFGAEAIMMTRSDPSSLVNVVRWVASGYRIVEPILCESLRVRLMVPSSEPLPSLGESGCVLGQHPPCVSRNVRLTQRQERILGLLSAGMTNRQIAVELGLSVKTVEFHMGSIFSVLGVRSRVEAAMYSVCSRGVRTNLAGGMASGASFPPSSR
jgi:DNA-binding NarL/FixJ family response regulator